MSPHASLTSSGYGRVLRPLWRLAPDMTFLNHGSYGACPRAVLAVQRHWHDRMEEQPVRFMQSVLPDALREAAAVLARFLGAEPADLVFVENATSGVNAVLRSLELEPGDELLTTNHVYPAIRNAVREIARRQGAIAVEAEVPFPLEGPEQVVEAITRTLSSRTRVVIVDAVTSPTAVVLPLAEIVTRCRAAGTKVLVDAAHAPGMIPLDLASLGADWVTGNLHKWLFAPKGCAFLWARRDAQAGLHPLAISHGLGQGFAAEFDWTGTRDPSAWLSAPAALAFWLALGGNDLMTRNRKLAEEAARLLAASWSTEIGAPATMRGAMATVALPLAGTADRDAATAIHDRLWARHKIEVPVVAFAGRLWVRISAQAYNEIDDYARLAAAISLEARCIGR